jgi:hypothetical protein
MRFDNSSNSPKTPDIWEDDVLGYKFCSVVQLNREQTYGNGWARLFGLAPVVGDIETFSLFCFSIYVTNRPQIVAIGSPEKKVGHAMIVYGLVGKQLFVCDPNYPGDLDRRIIMNTLFFDPYYSGENAKDLGTAFTQIAYSGIGALIDWDPIDSHWQELENKAIGNGLFPSYTILAENDTSMYEELKDGFKKKNGTFTLQVQGDGFESRFKVYEPGGSLLAFGKPFHLSKGNHQIGVAVFDKDTSWVGFRWFSVVADSDTARIYPLKVGNSWDYIYTSFREDGSTIDTEVRTYSVVGETVISGEYWYQMEMKQGTTTFTIAQLANRSDGTWLSLAPGSSTPHLLYKYPASVGDSYSSGVDGLTTVSVLEKEASRSVPGIGTYRHCHVYRMTPQGKTGYTDVTVAPGVGILLTQDFEPRSAGGGSMLQGTRCASALR